ncbi:hypothetical protein M0811_05247 [Anaeramoeba ignava]|uniref:ditrans,polycis-polyprenyl diphosphate synthase [(2E,6E)-farnesyldiphosphate specific] n=1 Tax=Anaeramoeba ignava TaxID=1746090 RepID=A0A9Q0LVD7_ANAIG|nr:hypothetical protein M0811_05247 [Anaeramoeba ignava]
MISIFQIIFSILYFIVFKIYRLIHLLHCKYIFLNEFISSIIHPFKNLKTIEKDTLCLNKKPNHIAFVLEIPKNKKNLKKIINHLGIILVWCVGFGIKYITVYDSEGILKQIPQKIVDSFSTYFLKNSNQNLKISGYGAFKIPEKIIQNLQKNSKKKSSQKKSLDSSLKSVIFDVLESPEMQDEKNNEMRNSSTNFEKFDFVVSILSEENGKKELIKLTKIFGEKIKKKMMSSEDITVDLIEENLWSSLGKPDPDLVLKFGSVENLDGFLPWQIRLSEIMFLGNLETLKYIRFFRSLKRFAKTQQRLGK